MLPAALVGTGIQVCAAGLRCSAASPRLAPLSAGSTVVHKPTNATTFGTSTRYSGTPIVTKIAAIVRRAFNARVTDTVRPMTAGYGAPHSWHKVGQAVDFVPAAGVTSITREQVRAAMAANGIRIIELLGPGDPGHADHWHLAFARPGQALGRFHPGDGADEWVIDVARLDPDRLVPHAPHAPAAPTSPSPPAAEAPPSWDVFATVAWREEHGGKS